MLRLTTVLGVLLVLVAVPVAGAAGDPAPAPAPAHAGIFIQCGDGIVNGSGWFSLRARNAACRVARSLADHFVFKAGGHDDGFKNWSCAKQRIADEVWRVKCARGKDGVAQRAKFEFGA